MAMENVVPFSIVMENEVPFSMAMENVVPFIIIIITNHDFLPPPRRGSHVKSDNTHTITNIHP